MTFPEPEIYVVGMASVYAGSKDLNEFWETVLTRRRGFREFPQQRLDVSEYGSTSREDRDKTYITRAALIDGFEFDWKAHRVPKVVYRATDPVHWLALTTAIKAIEEGGVDLDAVGRERIGVILGNSLTGEVSRANLLRLRWPYVRQSIIAGSAAMGLGDVELEALLAEVELNFKDSFPVPNEDTLAGALSNVIAGRICNVLDLNGGGYVVDGACSSSLLAISTACEALASGRLSMAIAGGVDISLDPLEMVGFARTGALTSGPMRVYDKNSAGFLPGEGCGMLVLMRGQEAERLGLKPWARIAGWGISSDGAGGITAPKASGQAMAMRRCYERSGFGADTLDFIEGHGTGTSVGDRQELLGFLEVTGGGEGSDLRRTGVTSVKTLLGHTKAAAGAAGLIKAVLAVNQRVFAPLAGLQSPADAFAMPDARIYPIAQGGRVLPETGLRAGVSGAGFGGINCHVAITSEGIAKREMATRDAEWLLASAQTAELFIASAHDIPALLARVEELLHKSSGMSEGELVDLAAACALQDQAADMRMAVVAETVDELRARLAALAKVLARADAEDDGRPGDADLPLHSIAMPAPPSTLLGRANPCLRVGFLIPGQGSQFIGMGRTLCKRSEWAADRRVRWDSQFATLGPNGLSGFIDLPVERADSPAVTARWDAALRDTRISQPAILMTSLQWLEWLRRVGITPCAVAGHSLGEIAALVAAGLLSEEESIDIIRIRAEACAAEGVTPPGGMLALKCDAEVAQAMIASQASYAVVANDNAPGQVVVAGEPDALAAIAGLAHKRGVGTVTLNVSKAFHSSHMAAAAEALGELARSQGADREALIPFFSVVQGGLAASQFDPYTYLARQIMAPVRFRETVGAIVASCDILVEVGPGSVLTGLARKTLGKAVPVCAMEPNAVDADAQFCLTMGQLFVAGASLDWGAFYADRHWRPFVPASERRFIENPCSRLSANRPGLASPSAGSGHHGDSTSLSQGPETFIARPYSNLQTSRKFGRAGDAGLLINSYPCPITTPKETKGVVDEASIEDIIRELVARETGYDLEMISLDARLARDLNLDSIKLAEVRAELRALGIELPDDLAMGTTPIRGIAHAAVRQQKSGGCERERSSSVTMAGVSMPEDLPVSGYVYTWQYTTPPSVQASLAQVLILHGPERAEEALHLAERLTAVGVRVSVDDGKETLVPHGVKRLVALPGSLAVADRLAIFFARLGALVGAGVESIILASRSGMAPVFGFAQSLSMEWPELAILAVEADPAADMVSVVRAQTDPGVRLLKALGQPDFTQSSKVANRYREMALSLWEPPSASAIPLQAGDVVVVSGGAKGITAECTFALLQATRARALLLGTSPEEAPGEEVEGTLLRIAAEGLEAVYLQCDVTDKDSVARSLQRGKDVMGASEIVGLVHGAGVNTPTMVTRLDPAVLRKEYAVKVGGLDNLLTAIGPKQLKLCVALGSVIGVVGMSGNSGYALANEALTIALQELKRDHPHIQVACPAYSVWSDVGMGAKLNVLESLERQHVVPIPIGEGIRWFLECCGQTDIPLPLAIAAPMHGLPTWRQVRGTGSASGLPFVDDRVVHEPGLVLVSRPSLNPQRDGWLVDHAFRGSLLFATVQALNAIGTGARLLAGVGVVTHFTNLRITRPIIAAHHGDTPIELDVRRTGTSAPDGGDGEKWTGRIGTPGTAWVDPAFDAQCWLGVPNREDEAMSALDTVVLPRGYRAVPAEVGSRLYDSILFQGRLFQRIEVLLGLDLADDVHRKGRFRLRREKTERNAPVPDPFFLDAMLQCLQVLVPRDLCLPVSIDSAVFYEAAWDAGAALVEAEIIEKNPTGYLTRVRAWNAADGSPVARYEGYRVSIVESHPTRPDAHAFFDPLTVDQAALARWLAEHMDVAGLKVALGSVDDGDQATRRAVAAAQIAGQIGIAPADLMWGADGAPWLAGQPGQGVSIAHDAARLLTVCSRGRVGCDLQRIGRSARPWGEMLPQSRTHLWRALTGAMNDRDRAGAIVWAIHEALIKAGCAESGVTFTGIQDGEPRFRLAGGGVIAAGVLVFVLAGPTAVAFVRLPERVEHNRVTHYTREIEMTFKEALPPLKSPTASIFCAWMGTLREEAMSDIRPMLAHAFDEGGKGMVTNGTRVRIVRPVRFHTPLRTWVWLNRILTSQPSTFELGFQWAETGSNGAPRRIVAQGLQRLTWVDVGHGAHVRVEPFPEFFARFIEERLPPPGEGPFTPPLGQLTESQEDEKPLWRLDPTVESGHGITRLWLDTDETHSNFVGNIYFSHAAALVERACHKALRHMGTCRGGFFATAFQLDHLGEAMPGDTLEAQVQLAEVGTTFCTFNLSLINLSQGIVKIAAGQARFCLFTPAPSRIDGPEPNRADEMAAEYFEPQTMPEWLFPHFAEKTL